MKYKMATLIQRVAVQALQTFSVHRGTSSFLENLAKLRSLVSHLTKRDIHFDENLVEDDEIYRAGEGKPPITYIALHEDDVFSLGVFVVKGGARLPLHDHPGMHGVIKVIHGKLRIRSYSAVGTAESVPPDIRDSLKPWQRHLVVPVKLYADMEVDEKSESCMLTPVDGNYHEVSSVGGPAAFLDILSPPYNESHSVRRECHYYAELTDAKPPLNGHSDQQYLVQIPQPSEFWGDSASYLGPGISPYSNSS